MPFFCASKVLGIVAVMSLVGFQEIATSPVAGQGANKGIINNLSNNVELGGKVVERVVIKPIDQTTTTTTTTKSPHIAKTSESSTEIHAIGCRLLFCNDFTCQIIKSFSLNTVYGVVCTDIYLPIKFSYSTVDNKNKEGEGFLMPGSRIIQFFNVRNAVCQQIKRSTNFSSFISAVFVIFK